MKNILTFFLFTPLLCLFGSPFGDITVNDLEKAIKEKKVAILDVNGAASYQKGHVPGAIEFSANQSSLSSLLPKDKSSLVVAYCGGPSCRAYLRGAEAAKKLGYKNIKHLSAGISGWKKAGKEISKPKK